MVDLAQNDDQLAAVIGHEIGHVLAQHSNERMSQATLTSVGLEVGSAVLGKGNKTNDAIILGAMGLTQVGILLPFSRAHEREADRLGQKFMAKAGYNPRQAAELWKLMSQGAKGSGPEFLSTHPSPASRISDLKKRAEDFMGEYQAVQPKPRCS
jgi:predicted Zn-dependent protease